MRSLNCGVQAKPPVSNSERAVSLLSGSRSRILHIVQSGLVLEYRYVQAKYRKPLHPTEPPTKLRIDASTICQLRCEGCGFQKSGHRGLGGFLSAESFRKVLDNNPQITRVELSNYGEIFLNPDLIDIMRCAFDKAFPSRRQCA